MRRDRATVGGDPAAPRIALFTSKMEPGGIQRMFATLACALIERGISVDVLLTRVGGEMLSELPAEAHVVELRAPWPTAARPLLSLTPRVRRLAGVWLATRRPRPVRSVTPLMRYLAERSPTALLASPTSAALTALWAKELSKSPVRVVAREANTLSQQLLNHRELYRRHLPGLAAEWYPRAAGIVAVSHGVAEDFARVTSVPRELIKIIHNPVGVPRIRALAEQVPDEPWLSAPDSPPVVLGVGRLVPAKDFATLLHAFALLRRRLHARLLLLGEGPERENLLALAKAFGIEADVKLVGHVANPFSYMARARVLASSSRYEGLANVLREALACGCPVIATDCPHGSADALENGALGRLVPIGDPGALADALEATIRSPRARAGEELPTSRLPHDRAVDAYLELLLGAQTG
jgi:glycosyltransferase involved in cell wall biosynthesis